jgi:aldose 1-epimerase
MPTQNYEAKRLQDHGSDVVLLADQARAVEVRIFPGGGNRAYSMTVNGQNILHFPSGDPGTIRTSRQLDGIPFLAPWANRMPEGFHANGKYYRFQMESGVLRLDGNGIPIHGLLTACPWWQVQEIKASKDEASVTSRLEFWRYPQLMANWPFAHEYLMTHRLRAGVLEVRLAIRNLSADQMPVAVGFHPYFQLPGVPITEAVAHVPVRSHVETDGRLVPTGKLNPVDFDGAISLADHRFDDGFTDLVRDSSGHTVFAVEGHGKKINVSFGPKYPVAIIYAPPAQNFICFEPMATLTNGVNLAEEGKYSGLQTVKPGETWEESFWVSTQGM